MNREFKIGEIIDFYEDLTAFENSEAILGKAVVTGWNGGLNNLTIAIPTLFSARLELDAGVISNIIPLELLLQSFCLLRSSTSDP